LILLTLLLSSLGCRYAPLCLACCWYSLINFCLGWPQTVIFLSLPL
jgi:hypothetical protein